MFVEHARVHDFRYRHITVSLNKASKCSMVIIKDGGISMSALLKCCNILSAKISNT